MNDYEERKQARIDRYREKAEKARQQSSQLSHESVSMLEHIPPGQPILVGHHSERGHRKLLERSDRKMEQSIAASEKADYYEHKAKAAENNTAISSDDPAALEKLQAKLARLQEKQAFTKRRWGKSSGVQGYHIIHSYTPGEVTPMEAHEMGVELAQRLLGDKYEAIVSTHLDHDHLHCHILFNSVRSQCPT